MSAVRPGTVGATRTCPHCKATILESSSVCPACRGHLKFDAPATDAAQRFVPLRVEGTVNAPDDGAFEYSPAFAAAAERGVVWDASTLERYLAAPTAMIPGSKMPLAVTDAAQRRDLVAYLATLSP